ncbi:cytochrome P450 [Periconia macrospinosa]|uniref:Cytochrome P450 n=1 Tax=Periconia macrospinosa TaxID=97972 RepID=A0A2V1DER3_9PLEO|nr:cytochrome P450 [Periconia macrospinosa]
MDFQTAIALVSGIFSHILYFRNGEHHSRGILYVRLALLLPVIVAAHVTYLLNKPVLLALTLVLKFELQYLFGIYTSILLYRISPFHRLRSYPGPITYRLSKLTHAFHNRTFKGYQNLYSLHQKYGDYVRTGPSELSIIDPDAVEAIFAFNSQCTRAAWYGMADPIKAIFHTRDRAEHEKRRQVWSQGLSVKSLKEYESRIEQHIQKLVEKIGDACAEKKPLNASTWLNYLSFDVMGEIGFGRGFGMLESGEKLDALKILENGQMGLGIFGVVPWLFMMLTKIPWISAEHDVFVKWCEKQMEDRKKRTAKVTDIAAALIRNDADSTEKAMSQQWLIGDSRILIVAGSDAVASSLVFALYHLAQDPLHTDTIRKELGRISGKPDAVALQNQAPYLNAFIAEVLRLWPPNPSGVLRQTPRDGVQVGPIYIPGDVTVCMPFWTFHRSPKCFLRPDTFLPERWLSQPELILRSEAYMPFGYGAYACIGKQLALMEMRLTLARLIQRFDIWFASGEDGRRLLEGSKDWFTWGLGDLMLVFAEHRCCGNVDLAAVDSQPGSNGQGCVVTRDAYFRVKGDGANNVYAIGDVVSSSKKDCHRGLML